MKLKNIMIMLLVFCVSTSFANQWHDEADRSWNEAQKYKKERNYKQAIEYLKRAVIAERKNENPRNDELIAQLNEIGQIYDMSGNYDKALHYYKLTLSECRKYKNADHEALALNSIGQSYYNLNRIDESLDSYREALEVSRKNGYKDKMLLVLNNMAMSHRSARDFKSARERYEEALALAKEGGSSANMAVITSNAGTMHYFMNDYDRALELYLQALELDRLRGGDESLSIDLSNIGSVYAALGKYGESFNYYEKALEIDQKNKNEKNMAARLFHMGDVYFRVGDNARAIDCYNRSLGINLKLNNSINAAMIQNSLGQVYDSMGKYEEALDYYIKALALNRDIEMKENIALRLSDIGLLYVARERYGEAVDFFGKALKRDMAAEKKNKIAENLSNIGKIMISMKSYDKALDYFRQSMDIYRDLGDSLSIADDSKNCGIVFYNMKDYEKATEYFVRAMRTIDAMPDKKDLPATEVRNDIYRWLIASYVKADRPGKAYEANEAFSISKIYSEITDTSANRQIGLISLENIKRNMGKQTALVIVANILWDNPFLIYIDSETAAGFELDKAATVKTVYNTLGKEIENFIGKKKTDIIFNISRKSRRDYYYIEFEKIINYYRSLLSKKYISRKEYEIQQAIGTILYQFIFKKIERNLEGKQTLIIQPEGALSTIPFETMIMSDGRYLAEKFGVKYSFSQTCDDIFSERKYEGGRKTMAILGGFNPPPRPTVKNIESLRHFDIIAEGINKKIRANKSILEMFGFFGIDDFAALQTGSTEFNTIKSVANNADTIIGDQGTETSLQMMSRSGSLGNYRILHVLSRGIVVPEVPQLSSLVLSYNKKDGGDKDGILTIKKISSLGLRADLVHLASVTIPATGYSRGEGIWNLCASLMIAGTRGVSLSLWDLDEATRVQFMKLVYEAAINRGITFENAFAQVKRTFIQGKADKSVSDKGAGNDTGTFVNPYFWGSFIYYGR